MFNTQWLSPKLATLWVLALGLLITAIAPAATLDITNQFAVARSGLVLNRLTKTFDATITLTNTSNTAVLAPITVVVGSLPSGVTLANQTGQRADGTPYVTPILPGSQLATGDMLSFVLQFANPQRVTITSTVQVLYSVPPPLTDAPTLIRVGATSKTSAGLIGRVDGAINLPITVQPYTAPTCFVGMLVSGKPLGTPIRATTDGAGYFGIEDVSGINRGDFVAVAVASPVASPQSTCLVSSADNDSWPNAFTLYDASPSASDLIDAAGKARWYKFSVTPGQRIQISLSRPPQGLPQDYTLAVFKDICQAFLSPLTPDPTSPVCEPDIAGSANTASPTNLLKLTAEYAPSVWSASVWSPSLFAPDAYAPPLFSPSVWSPSVWSPSVWSPSAFSPSVWSPSVWSPSVWSPLAFDPRFFPPPPPSVFPEIAQAFSAAQTRSVIGVSTTPGTGDKSVSVDSWDNTGNFYVRVTTRGDAFDTATPFTISVSKGEPTCVGVTDRLLKPRAPKPQGPQGGWETVIVTDSSVVALDQALLVPGGETLGHKLAAFEQRVNGDRVDVASDARVQELKLQAANNAACPFAVNLVAQEIKGIVDSYRTNNPLLYVVIVGSDASIPFFRSPDESGLGPESEYVPPVQSDSESQASLRLSYVLSQDAYGSNTAISLPYHDFPIPGLAVGRLVETISDIAGMIDAYMNDDDYIHNGVVSPRSSMVTGYDFLAQDAYAVNMQLQLAGTATDAELVTHADVSPQDPRPFPNGPWTAAALADKLFGSRHDVIFLAGHFSANSALAADFSTSLITTDLVASTQNFTNSIVFSAGCHSGYNLVDSDAIPGVTLPLDWPQAFARKKATLIAGTGYQYGDTDFIKFSEQIYLNFSQELRAGHGPVPIGKALVAAKLHYLATTPDIRGIPEKALLESTLFGLPMLAVNMPAGREDVPRAAVCGGTSVPVSSVPAQMLGLSPYDLKVSPSLTSNPRTLKNVNGGRDVNATYLSGPDGVATKPGEPVLPLVACDATLPTAPNLVLRGIGFRGGGYVDSDPLLPFSSAPTTELRSVHVPFISPVFYPGRMWSLNYFGAMAGNGGTQLLLDTPAQHRVFDAGAGTSTRRRFTDLELRLYYSGNSSQAALSEAPTIVHVDADAQSDPGNVLFTAQVVGDPAAAIAEVWVTYGGDGSGTWAACDLAQCVGPMLPAACTSEDSRLWKGRLPSASCADSPPANLKYMVQAVSGVGLVSLDDNRGAYYAPSPATPAATTVSVVAPPSTAKVGETVNVTAKLTFADVVALPEKIVAVSVGGIQQIGKTGPDGTVTLSLPLNIVPDTYQLTVSFAGDDNYQASSTTTSLLVNPPTSTLSRLAPLGALLTRVLGSSTEVLQQQPVSFAVTGPLGPVTISSITDYRGQATLPPPGLPAGIYTVSQAVFNGNATYAAALPLVFSPPEQFTVAGVAVTLNFDSVSVPPLVCLDASAYLANFGITFVAVTPPTAAPEICGSGPEVTPRSPPNTFAVFSNITLTAGDLLAGDLLFSGPVTQVQFTRVAVDPALTLDEWEASAYDASGNVLSSVSEPRTFPAPAAKGFTLFGPGITRLRLTTFVGDQLVPATLPLFDDLVLTIGP